MKTKEIPSILIIDDENSTTFKVGLNSLAKVRALTPNDVELEDLQWADLVLIDYFIEIWPERDSLDSLGLRPLNGLALASVMRECIDSKRDEKHSYTAFAIHSAHISDIATRLQTSNTTPQVVARLNNLEWAFSKSDQKRFNQEAILASGAREVSEIWQKLATVGLPDTIYDLLQIPTEPDWASCARDDVLICPDSFAGIFFGHEWPVIS